MVILPIICYLITAVTFMFPPLTPLFKEYKDTFCVPLISSAPVWSVKEASPPAEVCKSAEIIADLFLKASPVDVCTPVTEKGLSVVFSLPPLALPVCSAAVSGCKPDFTSGLFQLQVCPSPAFPFCPVSPLFSPVGYLFSLWTGSKSFTSTVKDLSQEMIVVLGQNPLMTIVVIIEVVYLLLRRSKQGWRREERPCSLCSK